MKKTLENHYIVIWHEGFLELEYKSRADELREKLLGAVFYSTEIKDIADCLVRQLNSLRQPSDISGLVFEVVDARDFDGLCCQDAEKIVAKYIEQSMARSNRSPLKHVRYCIEQERFFRKKLGLAERGNKPKKNMPKNRDEHLWKYLAAVFNSQKTGEKLFLLELIDPLALFGCDISEPSASRHYAALQDQGFVAYKRKRPVELTAKGLQKLESLITDDQIKKEMDFYGFKLS